MKAPTETGFTLPLLYALLLLAVKFFFSYPETYWQIDLNPSESRRQDDLSAFFLCGRPICGPILPRTQSGPALLIAALLYIRLARLYRAVVVDLRTTSSVSK